MKIRRHHLSETLIEFILKPFSTGLYGFAGFFSVILISKYLGVLIGNTKTWHVDISDLALSLLGFILMFLISFLKNFQEVQSNRQQREKNHPIS